ncbi:MAG: hypothetical protein IPL78_22865 [Chloroflexi bacterium]|nr:hypothetical protein [Chloroflexota bacterium]
MGGGGGVNVGDEKGGGEWTDEATVGLTEDWERKSWGSGVPLATRETAEERSLAGKTSVLLLFSHSPHNNLLKIFGQVWPDI